MSAPRWFRRAMLFPATAALALPSVAAAASAQPISSTKAAGSGTTLVPGDLLVATTDFQYVSGLVPGQTLLPPGCVSGSTSNPCAPAVAGGAFPEVFNNSSIDGSFGVTSSIVLDEVKPNGKIVGSIEVPNSTVPGYNGSQDQMVTSYSSKSELALNLSPDGRTVSFMGYDSPVDILDVSNSNTPGVNAQGTNPAASPHYRVIAELGADGRFHFTLTNAFSGDNGRAAILDPGDNKLFMAGNANDSGGDAYITSAGAQITTPSTQPEVAQKPGEPTPVASFGVTELGLKEGGDAAKEDNYRAVAIENKVLYFDKGSGGQGINSVYFVDTTGKACPNGIGVPQPGASLPTGPLNGATVGSDGRLQPFNMCLLAGFPQVLNGTNPIPDYPFGMFFANAHTLYLADEGNGTAPTTTGSYAAADPINNPTAGLQKWVYDPVAKAWHLAYTLQSGLNLGRPYHVKGYPTGNNTLPGGTDAPWAPAPDGLRQLTGQVNRNGTVTIYATTSTVSGSGDQGADPNQLVSITDQLGSLTPGAHESFKTLATASDGQLFRGVSFTPGTH